MLAEYFAIAILVYAMRCGATTAILGLGLAFVACSNDAVLLQTRQQQGMGGGGDSGGSVAGSPPSSGGSAGAPGFVALAPRGAAELLDSVGITVRLRDEAERQRVQEGLEGLRVRHARMFVPPPYQESQLDLAAALGEAGVFWSLVLDPRISTLRAGDLVGRVAGLESIEGPNDFDAYDIDLSAQQLRDAMTALRADIDGASSSVALIDGLDSRLNAVGDLSSLLDFGNFERARNRQLPGADLQADMDLERAVAGELPLYVTECGYATLASGPQSISEEAAARYLPRLLLAHLAAGIVRTYLDELSDDPNPNLETNAQGLIRADGTPKPAYEALRRLLERFDDDALDYVPPPFELVYQTTAETVRLLSLGRSDGTTVLAFWNEVESADAASGATLDPTAVGVTLELPQPVSFELYRPLIADAPIDSGASSRIELAVDDDVLLLELSP